MSSVQKINEIDKACNFTVSKLGQKFQGIIKPIYLFNEFCFVKIFVKKGTQNRAKKMAHEVFGLKYLHISIQSNKIKNILNLVEFAIANKYFST